MALLFSLYGEALISEKLYWRHRICYIYFGDVF